VGKVRVRAFKESFVGKGGGILAGRTRGDRFAGKIFPLENHLGPVGGDQKGKKDTPKGGTRIDLLSGKGNDYD